MLSNESWEEIMLSLELITLQIEIKYPVDMARPVLH